MQTQNMQNEQQQQQQQETYVNPQKYTITVETLSNGVINATIEVQFTANLIKKLLEMHVYPRCDKERIRYFSADSYDIERDVEEIIRNLAIKKALETNELKNYYKVILDVNDFVQAWEELIKQREEEKRRKEEERKRREEEARRREEEKKKMIEEIKEMLKKIPSELKDVRDYCAWIIVGSEERKIYFDEKDQYDKVKESYEFLKNVNINELLNLRLAALKEKIEKLEEKVREYEQQIETLQNIVRKLTNKEELERKLEELEEEEEEKERELTREEIEYLLEKVLETDEDDC